MYVYVQICSICGACISSNVQVFKMLHLVILLQERRGGGMEVERERERVCVFLECVRCPDALFIQKVESLDTETAFVHSDHDIWSDTVSALIDHRALLEMDKPEGMHHPISVYVKYSVYLLKLLLAV